jgi:hypothetical protein
MGRFPHGTWGVPWWATIGPGTIALLILGGLLLLALVVLALRRRRPSARSTRIPTIEVQDRDQEVVLLIELPGVGPDEHRLEAASDMLSIETSGERRYVTSEYLPDPVRSETLRSEFKNGLLTIRLVKEGYDLQNGPTAPEMAAA